MDMQCHVFTKVNGMHLLKPSCQSVREVYRNHTGQWKEQNFISHHSSSTLYRTAETPSVFGGVYIVFCFISIRVT